MTQNVPAAACQSNIKCAAAPYSVLTYSAEYDIIMAVPKKFARFFQCKFFQKFCENLLHNYELWCIIIHIIFKG